MQNAETILGIVHERGNRRLPLENVYRLLFNPNLYLLAYGKLYRNKGAMTPGITQETVDGMDFAKIETIIEAIRKESYQWTPVRRVYIEKKNSTKKRPLGIPTWSDKLLQEVMRLILEAYYEPQFSDQSHGFRPKRGCHTALMDIRTGWKGTAWFIEGDISKCFDMLDHEILLSTLKERIPDNRFIRLIGNLLKAGYLEDWRYNATCSGTPQGGVISPILSNIYLDKLDQFVADLQETWNKGKRPSNPEYVRLINTVARLKRAGQVEEARKIRREAQRLPAMDTNAPDHRRLRYIRYADDFILGFNGPRSEAETIKTRLREFLASIKLELSEEKTLITHARTEPARFLGYEIVTLHNDNQLHAEGHRRRINGVVGLKVPETVVVEKCRGYSANNKPVHLVERTNDTDYTIVASYQSEYRGIVEYYRLAYNLNRLNKLKWIMEQSLLKTLARKHRTTVQEMRGRYRTSIQTDDGTYKGYEVIVERTGKKPLVARWGGISLKWQKKAILTDQPCHIWNQRTELLERLMADTCELCGSTDDVQVHHIRALKDLKKAGRKDKPAWALEMASRQRKTLVVCRTCHGKIHAGRHDGQKLE